MNVRSVLARDAIPSVDDPSFADAYDGSADDQVVVVDYGEGAPRAYPVRYLHYHEIVNDRVGDVPVAVTWCPLCGSAVVYDRRVPTADTSAKTETAEAAEAAKSAGTAEAAVGTVETTRTLEFGVSGKLADDDLVMYDRETGSEWKQSLGRCIAGPLEGRILDVLPASLTTWRRFRDAHPSGVVLAPPGGESEAASDGDDPAPIDYDAAPYEAYFEMEGFGLDAHRGGESRDWGREDLDPKAVVLGVESDDDALGFPLPVVETEGGVVTATVGDVAVVVFATEAGVHAFEAPEGGVSFERTDSGGSESERFGGDGTTWDGSTGRSADGRELVRLPTRRLFAFAWQDDHGSGAFYGLDG